MIYKGLVIIFLFFFLSGVQSCDQKVKKSISITKEINFSKEGELTLRKTNDSIFKTLDIEIAQTDYETQTGLMYRKSMEEHQGMLFIFQEEQPRSFYMKNTEFSLDIIYINKKKEVVSIQKNTIPYDKNSLPSGEPVLYVLEIKAGLSDRWGIEIGDSVRWLLK
ncbi:MAG: DUF192 domain-containing protein [Flavobacteriales bacterium]|nr:MAG: DUF192 domain-containing protein [Flavobacteriales bacterium]